MKKLLAVITAITCLSFAGCNGIGSITPPKSTQEKIAAAYGVVASVRASAANALDAKVITVDDAKMVQSLANDARVALDIAKDYARQEKPENALQSLALAEDIIISVQQYLRERGVKEK